MAIDSAGLLFKIKADGSQARREAAETAAKVKAAMLSSIQPMNEFHQDFRAFSSSFEGLKKHLTDSRKGLDDWGKSARRAGNDFGQMVESIGEGDLGEILGEIAQQGGKTAFAIAAIPLAAAGAAVAIGAISKAVIENVREVDKLAREYKLTAIQIQSLQSLATLTGESVEDLAENYKKVAPQAKALEGQIKSTGAAIDNDLRQKTRASLVAFEELRIAGMGALNAIAREALPEVASVLRDVARLLSDNRELWKDIGSAAGTALRFVGSLVRELSANMQRLNGDMRDWALLASDVGALGIPFAIRTIRGAQKPEVHGPIVSPGWNGGKNLFDVPNLSKGNKDGGREDISELEKELRILRAAEAEARDLLDGRVASLEAYLAARQRVFEVERQIAEKELPNERAARLKEIQQKEAAATREFFEGLEKLSQEELEKEKQNVDDRIRIQQQRLEAERRFISELKALDIERREAQLEIDRLAIDRAKATGVPAGLVRIRELEAAREAEEIEFQRRQERHRRALEQAEKEFTDLEKQLEVQKRINAAFREEKLAHELKLAQIDAEVQAAKERQDPTSTRSLFGDRFAELLRLQEGGIFPALADAAQESFHRMSEAAGNFGSIAGNAISQVTQGLGQLVAEFVLSGQTGPAAMRKLAAGVLAGIAQQAFVKSIFELAEGFANLAKAALGHPTAAAAAALNFKSAALYAAVGGVAAIAGRAVAPSSGGDSEFRSSTGEDEKRKRVFVQDSKLGIGPILQEVQQSIASGDAGVTGAVSGVATGVGKGNSFLGQIAQDVALIREDTRLMTERSRDARNPLNRFLNYFMPNTLFGSFAAFSEGGYTGPGLRDAIKGVVHADEFVFSSRAVQNIGLSNMEAMHNRAKAGMPSVPTKPQVLYIVAKGDPGIHIQTWMDDYNNNGVVRQTIRNDVGANS